MSRTTTEPGTPTAQQYTNLQLAYDYFNAELFNGELADCLITLRSHGKRTLGLFHAEQWQHGKELCHEIALCPAYLRRPLRDVFGTLVHEMAHLWQQDHGKPSRNGYHNREWGTKMKEIGLHPSNTGAPEGKEVGQQMSHYILDDGPFAAAVEEMPDSIRLPWIGVQPTEKEKKVSRKVKYSCAGCDTAAWAKPGVNLMCGDCEEPMQSDE